MVGVGSMRVFPSAHFSKIAGVKGSLTGIYEPPNMQAQVEILGFLSLASCSSLSMKAAAMVTVGTDDRVAGGWSAAWRDIRRGFQAILKGKVVSI